MADLNESDEVRENKKIVMEIDRSTKCPKIFILQGKATQISINEHFLTLHTENEAFSDQTKISTTRILTAETAETISNGKKEYSLYIHYAKDDKENIYTHAVLILFGEKGNCSAVQVEINSVLQSIPSRPKRLLVIVNPESGRRRGKKIYEKVCPFFNLSNIETDVVVTERKGHAKNLLQTYDLSTTDGVVCVGGDGTYNEILNGLLARVQRDAGIDIDIAGVCWKSSSIPIGVIPSGTGNGIAQTLVCSDPDTAALAIIIGKVTDMPTYSIHECLKGFLTFGGLLMGYGYFGDVIYKSENRRWLGIMRYPVTMLGGIFNFRRFEVEIEYQEEVDESISEQEKLSQDINAVKSEDSSKEFGNKTMETTPEWIKLHGDFIDVLFFTCLEKDSPNCNVVEVSVCSNRLDFLRLVYNMIRKNMTSPPAAVKFFRTKRLRMKILPKRGNSMWSPIELALNCDGESLLMSPDPFIDISIQRGLIQAFCR